MLEYLKLVGVGPAPQLEVKLARRLNFVTGDNGLGKSFLLDVAWWALTRTWARMPAIPYRPVKTKPSITYRYDTASRQKHQYESHFDRMQQSWSGRQGRPPIPGMVIYAQVDGGFSVWDPARNYWKTEKSGEPDRPAAFLFQADEVWNGLPRGSATKLCNGLIADWAAWQREKGDAFHQLRRVLTRLSPSETESLGAGDLTRIALDDVRDHPTLRMPYGQDVALVHASAGMRRIVALAYLLVWTWQEHLRASELLGTKPAREIVFLIDEIEAHLHPQWQRRIVPSLLDVMEALTGKHNVPVQLITATHSPLVLASVEAHFDQKRDAIWDLDLVGRHVELRQSPWTRYGDVNSWLASSIFDLAEPRSVEAEKAMKNAMELAARPRRPSREEIRAADNALRRVLSDVDRFWVRWSAFVEKSEDVS